MKVLMICLGNICRSPIAEGILRDKAKKNNLDIQVDSAGLISYHVGENPDPRAVKTALNHNIDISKLITRMFNYEDFKKFDKIFVMDDNNYNEIMKIAKTDEDKQKVDYILNLITPGQNLHVPDPYYGNMSDFENTFQLIDKALDNLIDNLLNT